MLCLLFRNPRSLLSGDKHPAELNLQQRMPSTQETHYSCTGYGHIECLEQTRCDTCSVTSWILLLAFSSVSQLPQQQENTCSIMSRTSKCATLCVRGVRPKYSYTVHTYIQPCMGSVKQHLEESSNKGHVFVKIICLKKCTYVCTCTHVIPQFPISTDLATNESCVALY